MKEINTVYKIKEVILNHGKYQRKRLVIEFERLENAVLGEFLMTDAPLLSWSILQEMKDVLFGEIEVVQGSGNRTSWIIEKEITIISDLFSDMEEDIPVMESCTIETKKLYELTEMWQEKTQQFNKQ